MRNPKPEIRVREDPERRAVAAAIRTGVRQPRCPHIRRPGQSQWASPMPAFVSEEITDPAVTLRVLQTRIVGHGFHRGAPPGGRGSWTADAGSAGGPATQAGGIAHRELTAFWCFGDQNQFRQAKKFNKIPNLRLIALLRQVRYNKNLSPSWCCFPTQAVGCGLLERVCVPSIKIKCRANESVEQMLRRFKKLCEKDGLTKQIKRNSYYEKPSERRRRRMRKAARRMQRPPSAPRR